jgi:hypothetical protein
MSARRIILIILIIVVGVSIGITPSAIQFFAERELFRLQQRGVRIQAEGVSGFVVGLEAKQVESWIPIRVNGAGVGAIPVQLRAEDIRVSAALNPLALQMRAQATIYGGTAHATVTNLFSAAKIAGSAQRIDLAVHPQLRAFGVESGTIEASINGHPVEGVWNDEASYSISLDNLELLAPVWLQTFGGISQIRKGRATLQATVKKGGHLILQSSNFDCSLGSGALQGTALLKPGGDIDSIDGSIRVNLDRPDSDKVARWLPLMVGSGITSDAKSFICAIRSAQCGASGSQRVGKGCVNVTCAA